MEGFKLQPLPFKYKDLEPSISEETLKVHHDKHHQAYTDKFNTALASENITTRDLKEIFKNVADKPAIRNNGGGYFNHQFYFESLSNNGTKPSKELSEAINDSFGSLEEFKKSFTNSALSLFGSGWTWLGVDKKGGLVIYNTPNQDNFMMDICANKEEPILVIDIWEHAYYIDVQNARPKYVENFFNIINWDKVSERYLKIHN